MSHQAGRLAGGSLVYGELGGASNNYITSDGMSTTDGQTVRTHIGRLDAFTGGKNQFGLLVRDPAGTVIIDGTSNMFKIVASGTLTHSQAANSIGFNHVLITGAGLPTGKAPAFIGYVTQGTAPLESDNRDLGRFSQSGMRWSAGESGGTVDDRFRAHIWEAIAYSGVLTGDPRINLGIDNADGVTRGAFLRYHILKEAAI